MPYVADTHTLIWFLTGSSQLGQNALQIMRESAAGREIIVIPTIVLGELMSLCEKGKTSLNFREVLTKIESGDNYRIVPLDLATLKAASQTLADLSMHDRFIIATAKTLNLPLLTRDQAITQSGQVHTIW